MRKSNSKQTSIKKCLALHLVWVTTLTFSMGAFAGNVPNGIESLSNRSVLAALAAAVPEEDAKDLRGITVGKGSSATRILTNAADPLQNQLFACTLKFIEGVSNHSLQKKLLKKIGKVQFVKDGDLFGAIPGTDDVVTQSRLASYHSGVLSIYLHGDQVSKVDPKTPCKNLDLHNDAKAVILQLADGILKEEAKEGGLKTGEKPSVLDADAPKLQSRILAVAAPEQHVGTPLTIASVTNSGSASLLSPGLNGGLLGNPILLPAVDAGGAPQTVGQLPGLTINTNSPLLQNPNLGSSGTVGLDSRPLIVPGTITTSSVVQPPAPALSLHDSIAQAANEINSGNGYKEELDELAAKGKAERDAAAALEKEQHDRILAVAKKALEEGRAHIDGEGRIVVDAPEDAAGNLAAATAAGQARGKAMSTAIEAQSLNTDALFSDWKTAEETLEKAKTKHFSAGKLAKFEKLVQDAKAEYMAAYDKDPTRYHGKGPIDGMIFMQQHGGYGGF